MPRTSRRRKVSFFPSPASTRRRVRPVSSNAQLPELPDANIDTRNPILVPPEFFRVWQTAPPPSMALKQNAQQASLCSLLVLVGIFMWAAPRCRLVSERDDDYNYESNHKQGHEHATGLDDSQLVHQQRCREENEEAPESKSPKARHGWATTASTPPSQICCLPEAIRKAAYNEEQTKQHEESKANHGPGSNIRMHQGVPHAQQASRSRVRRKPSRLPTSAAAIASVRKNSCASACTSSAVTASTAASSSSVVWNWPK